MNTIRMIAIALPMTFLLACGGGGGGGVATAPSTGGGGGTPQALPTALITDAAAARNLTGSTAPTANATEAQQAFRSRITDADRLVASDAYVVSSTIPNGATVSTNGNVIIDGNTHRVSLEEVQMGVADWFNLTRFNSRYTPVMDHRRITLAEYRAAGRNGSDIYEYQSYGGWLAFSAFRVDMLTINDGSDDESSLLVGVSYGEESGSRPTGTGNVSWLGSLVGMHKSSGDVIQGNAQISINFDTSTDVFVIFDALANLNERSSISGMTWGPVTLENDGTFSSITEGDINGAFYGTTHMEVGGTFDRESIIGAFGATRQ